MVPSINRLIVKRHQKTTNWIEKQQDYTFHAVIHRHSIRLSDYWKYLLVVTMIVLSDSEDELFTQFAQEDDTLLKTDGDKTVDDKISGKAWGRVKNVITRRRNYPCSILLILGTEFCERFSYYGMRAILIIYLTKWLKFEPSSATAIFHSFVMLCYFSPVIGAVLADAYIGRYRTILYLSIAYAIGNLTVSLTALPPPEWYGPMIGLLLIAFGTGGIKPCVSAFGADQFHPGQEKERNTFFSAFYFMINLGSLFSILLTPVLRADVHCFGGDCYPLAFGVPAILMIIAAMLFVAGSSLYKRTPPSGNLFSRVIKCIYLGVKGKVQTKTKTKSHWLDYADVHFEQDFIEEVKGLLKVLTMFLPLPLFWALSDQQGSRWTLQAEQMDGDMGVFGTLKPDQLQALNPLLIIILIPVFEKLIYPVCDRCKVINRPLQRMVVGMFLTAAAFVIAALVQLKLESQTEAALSSSESGVTIINSSPCTVNVQSSFYKDHLDSFQKSSYMRIKPGPYSIQFQPDRCSINSSVSHSFKFKDKTAYRIFLASQNNTLVYHQAADLRQKPNKGKSSISLFSMLYNEESQIKLVTSGYNKPVTSDTGITFNTSSTTATDFMTVEPGMYDIYYNKPDNMTEWIKSTQTLNLGSGAVYTLLLNLNTTQVNAVLLTGVSENTLSMGWLVPQYVVITVGEILFSITGLSLAYSQAPKSMKSVVQAAWLMTTAVGDLVVVIVAEAQFIPSQVGEFFFFAALMALDSIIFMIMSYFYTYQNHVTLTLSEGSEVEDTSGLINNIQENEDIPLQEKNTETTQNHTS